MNIAPPVSSRSAASPGTPPAASQQAADRQQPCSKRLLSTREQSQVWTLADSGQSLPTLKDRVARYHRQQFRYRLPSSASSIARTDATAARSFEVSRPASLVDAMLREAETGRSVLSPDLARQVTSAWMAAPGQAGPAQRLQEGMTSLLRAAGRMNEPTVLAVGLALAEAAYGPKGSLAQRRALLTTMHAAFPYLANEVIKPVLLGISIFEGVRKGQPESKGKAGQAPAQEDPVASECDCLFTALAGRAKSTPGMCTVPLDARGLFMALSEADDRPPARGPSRYGPGLSPRQAATVAKRWLDQGAQTPVNTARAVVLGVIGQSGMLGREVVVALLRTLREVLGDAKACPERWQAALSEVALASRFVDETLVLDICDALRPPRTVWPRSLVEATHAALREADTSDFHAVLITRKLGMPAPQELRDAKR